MSDESQTKENPHHFMGVPREKIEWYPTIDPDKCNGCGDCVKFCAHDVYEMKDGKVNIKNPKNCVVLCQACLKMCPIEGAMIFPTRKEIMKNIQDLKKQAQTNSQ